MGREGARRREWSGARSWPSRRSESGHWPLPKPLSGQSTVPHPALHLTSPGNDRSGRGKHRTPPEAGAGVGVGARRAAGPGVRVEPSPPDRTWCPPKHTGRASNPGPSTLPPTPRQRPVTRGSRTKQQRGGRRGSSRGRVFPSSKLPSGNLIIISLLAEKPNKWQEKKTLNLILTHTRTRTHKDERSSELQSGC